MFCNGCTGKTHPAKRRFSASSERIASYISAYEALTECGPSVTPASIAGNGQMLGGPVKITEKARADLTAKLFVIEKYDQMNSEVHQRIAQMSCLG